MFQGIAYTHKQVGVNARTTIYFIYVIGRTIYLLGKPCMLTPLLLNLRLYQRTYMYVLYCVHKKSVELISCLCSRVSTPHQSNKLFHAVAIRHFATFLDWLCPPKRTCGNLEHKDSHKCYL